MQTCFNFTHSWLILSISNFKVCSPTGSQGIADIRIVIAREGVKFGIHFTSSPFSAVSALSKYLPSSATPTFDGLWANSL